MPAIRKRTNVLVMNGAGVKNPARIRARMAEAISDGPIGEPPERLPEIAKAVWREVVLTAPWLRVADRLPLEMVSVLMAQFREELSATPPHCWIRLETLCGRLGLSPADRTKIKDPGYRAARNEFSND